MSIVHVDKIWVKILRCGRPGGGGWPVISDTPGRGGEGGSKKGKFLRTSFMDGPLLYYVLWFCVLRQFVTFLSSILF